MLFYEIRHAVSGEALPEPIFRTEAGAQDWLDYVRRLKRREDQGYPGPLPEPIIEQFFDGPDDLCVGPASDVVTDPSPDSAVGVVAEAMRQMWNRDSVGMAMVMRARQIVGALEKAGFL